MKSMQKNLILAILCALFVTGTAAANLCAPKWIQQPDTTPTGLDVRATYPVVLADDFLCTEARPITDIHIWGSWLNDNLPGVGTVPDAANVTFKLSIHADIPVGGENNYSRPGEELWSAQLRPTNVQAYARDIQEGWYDPYTREYFPSQPNPADTVCWQYDFIIDPLEAFEQQGSSLNPVTYWLDVQATPDGQNPDVLFGWKSSLQHWNDDAVWADAGPQGSGTWLELEYPDGHQYEGQSIDLAFAITPEPTTVSLLGIGWLMARTARRKRSRST